MDLTVVSPEPQQQAERSEECEPQAPSHMRAERHPLADLDIQEQSQSPGELAGEAPQTLIQTPQQQHSSYLGEATPELSQLKQSAAVAPHVVPSQHVR